MNANLELARMRRAVARADAASHAKSQFLQTTSHELRTPLNAALGYLELLELGLHGPVTDAQRESLARIRRSQRHLLGLVTQVLNFSRIEVTRRWTRVAARVSRDVAATEF